MPNPTYQIQGQMPFGQGGNPLQGAEGGLNGLANQYGQGYQSALAQNQALYGNILAGYQQTIGNQTSAQQALQGGYTGLYNTVQGTIQGIDQSQRQAIADAYAGQQGQMQNSMVSRGLGNTTVQDSMQRGLLLDKSKADIALSNQTAQLQAGYQANLGLAGLNFGNQANMQNTGQANQQLGWMNTVQAPYPHAQEYSSLYQQQGQWQQAQADRSLMQSLGQQRSGVAGATGGGAGARGSGSVGSSGGNFGLYSHPILPETGMYGGYGGGGGMQPMGNQGGLPSGYTQLQPPQQQTGFAGGPMPDQQGATAYDPYTRQPNQWGATGSAYDFPQDGFDANPDAGLDLRSYYE